jgi:hypothetical protein
MHLPHACPDARQGTGQIVAGCWERRYDCVSEPSIRPHPKTLKAARLKDLGPGLLDTIHIHQSDAFVTHWLE